jgi:hypothetical protein
MRWYVLGVDLLAYLHVLENLPWRQAFDDLLIFDYPLIFLLKSLQTWLKVDEADRFRPSAIHGYHLEIRL